jgi:hypothetical protein
MKPEKFDGKSSFESFIYQFENCASYNNWKERDKVAHLRWALTGAAAQLLWNTTGLNYDELVKKLRDRYGGKGLEEKFQNELRCRRRGKHESIRELAQDVQRLMVLAYPEERSRLSEHIARDAFLTALDDPEMELKIREREPGDLDSAVKMAQRFEVFKGAIEASGVHNRRLNRLVINEAVSTKQPAYNLSDRDIQQCGQGQSLVEHDNWRGEMTRKIKELESSHKDMSARNERMMTEKLELSKELDRLRYLDRLRSATSTTEVLSPAQSRQDGRLPVKTCFKCKQSGHFVRDCPARHNRHTEEPRSNESGVGESAAVQTSRVTEQVTAERRGAVYLRARIDGRLHDCLLDTGSEMSILPAKMVKLQNVQQTANVLKAANGTPIPVLGEAQIVINVGTFKSTLKGLVSEHVEEVMLGIDWLVGNKVVWDFSKSQVRIAGRAYNLRMRASGCKWSRRVVLQEEVVVPARSEMDVPTKIVFHDIRGSISDQLWQTEPTLLRPGIHVSRTLISPSRSIDLPIRILNTSTEAARLPAGTVVSDLQSVSLVDENVANVENQNEETTVKSLDEPTNFIESMMRGVHPSVPETEAKALEQLLIEYSDVFSRSDRDLGLTDIVTHNIDTGDARPIRQQLRRFPPVHAQIISDHVDNMLAQGTIEPACSPWASNVVLVRKKDGSYRCCIDYRQLNTVTKKDAYPLPRIDVCLDAMAKAKWFSTFDLRSSYHQVSVNANDRDKTAFICPRGMFRFRTMPFGLCNAGASFQRLMDFVLSGLHPEICLVYLDDIIVFSESLNDHLQRLSTVLCRMRTAGLKLKPEKCFLMQKSVSFLGHVISEEGIATDPEKTRAVTEWPVPTCTRDVRAFLGLAGYYRRFVRDFAVLAAPLHDLIKNDRKFDWSEDAQLSFDALKGALTSPPILAMPTDYDEVIVDTDASDGAIGAVLSQRQDGVERVIAYASRALDRRERNYCVTRKELLAVVHFLKRFNQYLIGRKFKVRTDHAALSWLRHTPDPIGQQARWLEQLEEFDFTVEHRPGNRHANADAMSRRPCTQRDCACRNIHRGKSMDSLTVENRLPSETNNECCAPFFFGGPVDPVGKNITRTCATERIGSRVANTPSASVTESVVETTDVSASSETIFSWSMDGIRASQNSDEDIGFLISLMALHVDKPPWEKVAGKSSDVKALWHQWARLSMQDRTLKRKFESVDGKVTRWQIVWPKSLRSEFMTLLHTGMAGGHLGYRRMLAAAQMRVYWPTWSSDLKMFLKRCQQCAQYKRGSAPRQTLLQTPLVGEPWERISVDVTGPHPKSSRGNQFMVTLVDHFSKWAEAIPVPNHTAQTVARVLMTNVFSRFGAPKQILTDRGPEFEGALFSQLLEWMQIDKLRTTAYKPATNGVVERFHRTLNSMLGKMVKESQRDWDEKLPFALAAYRATQHDSSGYTPNKLFLGREVRTPLDLIMGLSAEDALQVDTMDDYVVQMYERAESAYKVAREHLRAAAERRKATYDIRVKPVAFCVGDWVWYWYPRRYQRRSPKWQRQYTGPYLVVRVISPCNFVLQKSKQSKQFVVHGDKLKKCLGATPFNWLTNQVQEPSDYELLEPQPPDRSVSGETEGENVPTRPQRQRRKPARYTDSI